MLPPLGAAHPHILILVISLAFINRFVRCFEHQQGLHGDSTGRERKLMWRRITRVGGRGGWGGQSVIKSP